MDENKEQEKTTQNNDERDLELMEIEIYRQHWRSLNAALADIKALRGADAPEIDPVEYVKEEVSNLKAQFSELKELIQKQVESSPQPQPQQQRQNTAPVFQPQPMAVPLMPYYQTPNYAPYVPTNN